jgi:hypothetical protein
VVVPPSQIAFFRSLFSHAVETGFTDSEKLDVAFDFWVAQRFSAAVNGLFGS